MLRRGIGRVGRPGLLGVAARTAVVAGTATAVSGNVARRQQASAQQAADAAAYQQEQQYAAQQPQPQYAAPEPQYAAPPAAPAASAGPTNEDIERLQQLASMRDQGILTEAEFAAQKARILGM